MQLNNKCCHLVFSCMQQNFKNLKHQFEKERLRFSKIQSDYEISMGEASAKIRHFEAENRILRNDSNVMKMNLEWTNKRNKMLEKKLKNQENDVNSAVNNAVKCSIEAFGANHEKMVAEMSRAKKLNENLKSEIEILKIKLQYFQSQAKVCQEQGSPSNCKRPKISDVLCEEFSEASSMADFQWELNSLTGDSNSSYYPDCFAENSQVFATKKSASVDSDLDNLESLESLDSVWMESEIEQLENRIRFLSSDSKKLKIELKEAKTTISMLTRDLCSIILPPPCN